MLKNTGIRRKIDELGRIVIPMEIRNKFDINEKDPLEIYVDTDKIILKKYEPSCVFCGNNKGLVEFKDKLICQKCAGKIREKNETADKN